MEIFDSDEEESEDEDKESEEKKIKSTRNISSLNKVDKKISSSQRNILNDKKMVKKTKSESNNDKKNSTINNKAGVLQSLEHFNGKMTIVNFLLLSIVSTILLVGVSLITMVFQRSIVDKYSVITMICKENNQVLKNLFVVKSAITDVMLFKAGTPAYDFDKEKIIKNFRSRLKFAVDSIANKSQMIVAQAGNTDIELINYNILNNSSMTINYTSDSQKNVTYKEGLSQFVAAGINLQPLSIYEIVDSNTDIQFLDTNLLNGGFNFVFNIFDKAIPLLVELSKFK